MNKRRPLIKLALLQASVGLAVAGLVTAGWFVAGSPVPAQGAVWFQVVASGEAHLGFTPDKPFFAMVVGSDSSEERGGGNGLGDALHVIGINPAAGQGTIINIPRDTVGPNGGKINAYNSAGGLAAQTDAVSRLVGIQMEYAIGTNIDGFVNLINALGGVDINIPFDVPDSDAPGLAFPAGPAHLDGDTLSAFARNRKSFPSGDIQRTANQALVLLSILGTLEAHHPTAADTMRIVALIARHVNFTGLNIADAFQLGRYAMTLDPTAIRSVTVPVGNAGGTNLAPTGEARGIFADFADDAILQSH